MHKCQTEPSLNIGSRPVSDGSSWCQEYSWVGVSPPVSIFEAWMNDLVEHVIRAGWPKHVMQKSKLWDLRFCFAKKVWKKVAEPSWMIIQVFKFFERPPLILKRIEIIHLPSLNIGLASIRAFASATSALENHLKSFYSSFHVKDNPSFFRLYRLSWKTLDHLP